jgi:hypothetical protein
MRATPWLKLRLGVIAPAAVVAVVLGGFGTGAGAGMRAGFPDDRTYQQALSRNALTEARLRDLVGDNIRIESYLDQRFNAAAQPTPDEVERYYLDHPSEFMRNGRRLPLDAVRADAVAKVTAERRNFLIVDWLDRVRRRFPVSNLYSPPR